MGKLHLGVLGLLLAICACGVDPEPRFPAEGGQGGGAGGEGGNGGSDGTGGNGGTAGGTGTGGWGGDSEGLSLIPFACYHPTEPIRRIRIHAESPAEAPLCLVFVLAQEESLSETDLILPKGWSLEAPKAFAHACKEERLDDGVSPTSISGEVEFDLPNHEGIPLAIDFNAMFVFDASSGFPYPWVKLHNLEYAVAPTDCKNLEGLR